jgi:pimeloyl-ACP methyl ester carboxylesterase
MTTFAMIPGAGGDAWYWHRVAPLLRAAGHEVVPVDLPAGDDKAGWREYADCVVAAVREHAPAAADGDGELVVVAQSMAGFTAPLVVGPMPVTSLVLVNAMIPAPGETGGEWWENTGSGQARRENDLREGRDPDAPFDELATFFHDVPDSVTEVAMARPPQQSDTPFAQPWPRDAWPDVPTRVLSGTDDRLFPVEFQERVARERLGLTAQRLPGGHLVMLSQPEACVAALLR